MLSPALPSLHRSALRLLGLAFALAIVPALHASPITYQMTFTSGTHTGSGTLTLASPPSSSGVTNDTVTGQQIQNLTFVVANQTFSFSTDPSASVQFVNGQISKITFGQESNQSPAGYTVEFANGFSLYGSNDLAHPILSGSFTVTPDSVPDTGAGQSAATSPTPEPGTLILLATAFAGAVFLILRRRRAAHS